MEKKKDEAKVLDIVQVKRTDRGGKIVPVKREIAMRWVKKGIGEIVKVNVTPDDIKSTTNTGKKNDSKSTDSGKKDTAKSGIFSKFSGEKTTEEDSGSGTSGTDIL